MQSIILNEYRDLVQLLLTRCCKGISPSSISTVRSTAISNIVLGER